MIDVFIVVSDIHCGSEVGLAPPQTTTRAGNKVSFGENHHQAWLWEKWTSGIAEIKSFCKGASAALIVNGDATEGSHHRNEASLIAADIEVHTSMAAECLKPLKDLCKKTFVVKGTECHTQNMENELAKKLRAENNCAKDKWLIENNGCLIDAAHHMSTTARAYLEAGAMSILMNNARLNYLRTHQRVPNVFLRGHRHCGGSFTDDDGLWGVTGGWQFLTRHGFKVVTDSIPRPSFMLLDFRGRKPGRLPVAHSIKFDPTQDEIHQA